MTYGVKVPVSLSSGGDPEQWTELAAQAREVVGDPAAALSLGARWAGRIPHPGSGSTVQRWDSLATLGAVDLTVARAIEPHLDALAIRAEAGLSPADASSTWAVWAAEGPAVRVEAQAGERGHRLHGTKPWCSLAETVTNALVTGWVDDRRRSLFAVALDDPAADPRPSDWVSRGLPRVTSGSVEFSGADAEEIGGPDWYLLRPGFAWGGIGVAAVWYGGAVALARRLWRQAQERELDQVGEAYLGTVDARLWAARAVLAEAGAAIDAGDADGADGATWAMRVRQAVVDAAEEVLLVADHALGPGPLTGEEDHAAAVADLRVYLRQHHGERDTAALGRALLHHGAGEASPW